MRRVVHVDVRWSFADSGFVAGVASLVRGVKLAMSAVRLRGIWRRAVPVEGCDAGAVAAGVRGVELCTSEEVDRPSVIGFFSPRILIPEGCLRVDEAELGQVVLHEMGHLRRADDWINLLQKLSLVVFPLNPVLVWIERRLCLERELACDEGVLRLTGAPKAYATCLTNLAEHRLGRRAAALTLGAWERRSELAQRVHRIFAAAKGWPDASSSGDGCAGGGAGGRGGGVGAVPAAGFVFAAALPVAAAGWRSAVGRDFGRWCFMSAGRQGDGRSAA